MKKYIVSLLAILALCVTFCIIAPKADAATVASGRCGLDLTWTLDDQGVLSISGTGSMYDFGQFVQTPWDSYRTSIKKLVISDGVATICDNAFYDCDGLTSVTIPGSISYIGSSAFAFCDGLTAIYFNAIDADVGDGVFGDSGNDNGIKVIIGSQVTRIPDCLFAPVDVWNQLEPSYTPWDDYYCYAPRITSVEFEKGSVCRSVGDVSFYGCRSLWSIVLPDSVTSIGYCTFGTCWPLTMVCIPDSVTSIDSKAFWSCSNLAVMTIGNGVTNVDFLRNLSKLSHVAYTGTESQWNEISGDVANTALKNATLHFETHFENYENCVESGIFCPACDKAVLSIKKNPDTHKYENGQCTACGAPDPSKKFDIDVSRMRLGNALEFQFGVAQTKIPDTTGYYALIEKEWADGTTTTKTIPATEWGEAGQYWAVVYDGLAAKEMGDTFYVTIYNAKGQAVSNAREDSVRAYVERAYKSQSATGKTMMVDMLNYGAAAQVYFNYNTSDLANKKLSVEQKAAGTLVTPEMSNDQIWGDFYMGSRFILKSRIQLQLAFENLTEDMYAIYTYTKANGKFQTVRVEGKDFVVINGKPAGVELSALVYADARALVNVTVYNADGTVYGTATDSIESCAVRSTGDVFVALMKFADSAKAHLYG